MRMLASRFVLVAWILAMTAGGVAATAGSRWMLQVYAIDQIYGAERVIGDATFTGTGRLFLVDPQLLQGRENTKYFLRGKDARLYEFEVIADGPSAKGGQLMVKTTEPVPQTNMFAGRRGPTPRSRSVCRPAWPDTSSGSRRPVR